jgi:hypothetical protein
VHWGPVNDAPPLVCRPPPNKTIAWCATARLSWVTARGLVIHLVYLRILIVAALRYCIARNWELCSRGFVLSDYKVDSMPFKLYPDTGWTPMLPPTAFPPNINNITTAHKKHYTQSIR